eukprot:g2701.t1
MLSSPVDESYGTNTGGASSDQPQSPAKNSGAFGPAGAHVNRGKYENLNLREQSYHASDLLHRVFGKLSSLATSPMTVPAASSSGGGGGRLSAQAVSAQAVRAVVLVCGIFVMLFVMDKMYRQVVDDSVHEFDAEIEDELAHDRVVKNIVSQNAPLALGRGGTTAATMVRVQDGNSRAGTTAAAPDASVTAQLPLLTATTSEDRGVNDVADRGEDVKKPLKLMIAIPTHNRVGYVRFLADVRKQFLLKDMPKESFSEYTPEDLKEWFDLSASHVYRHGSSMGPEICMHQIVRKFLQKPQFDALLVLDSDLVPAVNFRHAVESILPALGVTGGLTSAFANSHRTLLTLFNPSHFYSEHRKIGEFSVAESLRSLSEAAKSGDEQATDASEKSLATLSESGVARQQKQAKHIDATYPLEEKESAGTGGLLITWGVAHDLMYGSFDLDKKLHNWRRPRAAYKFDEQLIKFVHGHNPGMNTVGAAPEGGAGGSSSSDGGRDAAGAATVLHSSSSRRWKFVAPKHSLLMHIGMFGRYHHDDVANPNNLGGIEGQVVSGTRPGQTNLLTHHLGTSHGGMDTQQFPLWKQPAFVRGGIKWFYTQKHSPTHLYKHDGETDN